MILKKGVEQADCQLHILKTKLHYPAPSSYDTLQSKIYTFNYTIHFSLRNKNRILIPSQCLSATRNILIDKEESLESTEQLEVFTREMESEIISRLLEYVRRCYQ